MRLVISALLMFTTPVAASTTMCMFDPPSTAPIPTLEFLGYEKIGPVLIHVLEGPRSLPYRSWKVLEFDQLSRRIRFAYTNPGDPSLPPSFTLSGQGQHTQLTVGGKTYAGELRCDF